MEIKLSFHGATGNVTGSCYILEANGLRIMVDCGLYQEHDLKDRNWKTFPISPYKLNALILTHAHLDHSGRIPRLVRNGFRGPIYCTRATCEIASIVMEDCGKINEEDAEFKRKRHEREGRVSPHGYEPLYTEEDAEEVAQYFLPVDYEQKVELGQGVTLEFLQVGHILGAACCRITVTDGTETRRILFSGDVGRWDMPILQDPVPVGEADYVLVESTYGNREHGETKDIPEELARIINDTADAGGNLIIPSFAVERTQELLYFLALLNAERRIPNLRIFVDSPMASKVNTVFVHHPYLFDDDTLKLAKVLRVSNVSVVRSSQESKALNHIRGSVIIISGSGMCTGGRIKHHLCKNIGRPESTILFVGYQARNTLGRQILDGEPQVRILGETYDVKANIQRISGFSAHADRNELLRWLNTVSGTPRRVFVTHGEPEASAALRDKIIQEKGWDAQVPQYQQTVILD
jgi:metallo-beta-lactamase family protein